MIRSITAATREIDDAQAAVAELMSALRLEENLLKNSLGVISCFSEFADTGVLKAVCDALPFDCVGATTSLCATGGEVDQIILALTVLTSDDCAFETALIPVAQKYHQSVQEGLEELLARRSEKPALLLSYFPLMNTVSGDMILAAVDKATGGIPLFGTSAVDHMMDYSTSQTIHNGLAYREAVALGAIYGEPQIVFETAALDENKIRKQKAIITASEGNLLLGVNGKNALEYLEEVGLTWAEVSSGMGILPLMVDYKDGTRPVARAVFTMTPEGHAVCGGEMPVGTALTLGSIDKDDVLKTTQETLAPLAGRDGAVLGYSCMARFLVLGADNTAEAERVIGLVRGLRHLFAYSGGEICPMPDASGRLRNVYHNYTAVFCHLS